MILVDTALRRLELEQRPIRVGLVGAGFMGRAIAYQVLTATPGMRLVAIASRVVEAAERAYRDAGTADVVTVDSVAALEAAVDEGRPAATADGLLLAKAGGIDVLVDATGTVDFGAALAVATCEHKKHLVLMNAELGGTLGPILKVHADRAGVVVTDTDGDEPGVTLNLFRYVRSVGIRPVLCGNIKGFQDRYRNPHTQVEYARTWKQKPQAVASFADGTKMSFEQAIVGNAVGMGVAKLGMYGPELGPEMTIDDALGLFPLDGIASGPGIVDYVVGSAQAPGVFIIGENRDPFQQSYLDLYKLGKGPYYIFYTPHRLVHFETPQTIARAAIFGDATIAPLGRPYVDVVAAAKTDLDVGTMIDGLGGFATYGLCEDANVTRRDGLLPIGLAEGARLVRRVRRDQVLRYEDVQMPETRFADRLRREQDEFDWDAG